jgi:mRNA-degrading endonuclease RelE of RelBE toxin-antitoxin system
VWILSVPANVRRQISKLPTAALSVEAGDIIEDLAEDPFPADALKTRKYKDHIRFGSEAYRIVYRVNFEAADRHNSSGST